MPGIVAHGGPPFALLKAGALDEGFKIVLGDVGVAIEPVADIFSVR